MSQGTDIFDRRLIRRRRDRAATDQAAHDFLVREVGDRLADRLDDLRRRFPVALDLGCCGGQLARLLGCRGHIERLVLADPSPRMAAAAGLPAVVADEDLLPFRPGAFDLVLSNLALHRVNDVPGALVQIRDLLRPDGLFLASFFGGETLVELRTVLAEAEIDARGGTGPRVSPFADVADAGALMQRTGFALPVVDSDRIVVTYPDMFALVRDLRGMGEGAAMLERADRPLNREIAAHAAALYGDRFGTGDGRVRATFQVIYLTGWAPDPSRQQAPLRPGAAKSRLAEALGTSERPAGDKTPRRRGG